MNIVDIRGHTAELCTTDDDDVSRDLPVLESRAIGTETMLCEFLAKERRERVANPEAELFTKCFCGFSGKPIT